MYHPKPRKQCRPEDEASTRSTAGETRALTQGQPQSPGTVQIQDCTDTEGSNRRGDRHERLRTCLGPGRRSQPPHSLSPCCTMSLGTTEAAEAGASRRCAQSERKRPGAFKQERERERSHKKKKNWSSK